MILLSRKSMAKSKNSGDAQVWFFHGRILNKQNTGKHSVQLVVSALAEVIIARIE